VTSDDLFRHNQSQRSCFAVIGQTGIPGRLIITQAVPLSCDYNFWQRSLATPSELFDWPERYLDIYLFCVCAYSIPANTSDELRGLLHGLLRRNPADRLDFRKNTARLDSGRLNAVKFVNFRHFQNSVKFQYHIVMVYTE